MNKNIYWYEINGVYSYSWIEQGRFKTVETSEKPEDFLKNQGNSYVTPNGSLVYGPMYIMNCLDNETGQVMFSRGVTISASGAITYHRVFAD